MSFSLAGCGNKVAQADVDPEIAIDKGYEKFANGTHHVQMSIQNYGNITLEVYSYAAPKTASTFIKNVNEEKYDNMPFSTIMNGLYLGTVTSQEAGELPNIKGEFEDNDYFNLLSLKDCMVAMGKSDDKYHSDSSKLLFILSDCSFLDGKYATFARVDEGFWILTSINDRCILKKNATDQDLALANLEITDGIDKNSIPIILEENGSIMNIDKCPKIEWMKVID